MRTQYNEQDWLFTASDSEINPLEDYLKSDGAKEIKTAIKSVNDNYVNVTSSNKKSYFSYLAIAASIIVLVGYFMFNSSPNNMELYAQYNDWSNLPSFTTRGDSDNKLLVSGEKAFLDSNYLKAKNYFEEFLNTSEEKNANANALLYYGITNIELGDFTKALESFNKLIASETLDSSKGYWYKALMYLKMDDKASAIKELKIIVTDASNYNYTVAKELLSKLKD